MRWLLPVGARAGPGAGAFLSTASGGGAANIKAEFDSSCALTAALLDLDRQGVAAGSVGNGKGGGGAEVRGRRLDDGDDTEPVALLRSPARRLSAVVFPTPETLGRVRELAEEIDSQRTLLLADPQWNQRGNLLSDFGFGTRRERDEAFVNSFQEVYSLSERRVGNTTGGLGLPLGARQGAVVRLLRCYPGAWQVHVMEPSRRLQEGTLQFLQDRDSKFMPAGERATREPIAIFEQYPSYSELEEAVQGYMDRRLRSWWTQGGSLVGAEEPQKWAAEGAGTAVPSPQRDAAEFGPPGGVAGDSAGMGGGSLGEPPVFGELEVSLMDEQLLRAALQAVGQEARDGAPEAGEEDTGGVERLRRQLKTAQQVRLMQGSGASIAQVLQKTQSRCRVCGCKIGGKSQPGRRPCPECSSRPGRTFDCPTCGGWGYTICPACLTSGHAGNGDA